MESLNFEQVVSYVKPALKVFFVYILPAAAVILAAFITANNTRLRDQLEVQKDQNADLTVELQRVETLLIPFKTIALTQYSGDENEALAKLANKLRHIQDHLGELDRLSDAVGQMTFTPFSTGLTEELVANLRPIAQEWNSKSFSLRVTYEPWTPLPTRKFVDQLGTILAQAGFNVSGPDFSRDKDHRFEAVSSDYPVQWRFNWSEKDHVLPLVRSIESVIDQKGIIRNGVYTGVWTSGGLPSKDVWLHFHGQATFSGDGSVTVR